MTKEEIIEYKKKLRKLNYRKLLDEENLVGFNSQNSWDDVEKVGYVRKEIKRRLKAIDKILGVE